MARLALVFGSLALCAALWAPAPARAEGPEIRRHGPACTPLGCPGDTRGSGSAALGFAAAVLATGALARRGRQAPR